MAPELPEDVARLPTTTALEVEADTAEPEVVEAVAALVEDAVPPRSLREVAASVQEAVCW